MLINVESGAKLVIHRLFQAETIFLSKFTDENENQISHIALVDNRMFAHFVFWEIIKRVYYGILFYDDVNANSYWYHLFFQPAFSAQVFIEQKVCSILPVLVLHPCYFLIPGDDGYNHFIHHSGQLPI